MRGLFKNCNTREALKALDKNALFERVAGDVWAAILENFHQADGSVAIPAALHPYMRGTTVITGR